MLNKVKFIFCVIMTMITLTTNAQVTNSSMSGVVTDTSGEPIIGATVQAIHEPSGSRYGSITNIDGRFTIQGMRTGGPYDVEVSYVGYQRVLYKDIYLQLGEVYTLNVKMEEASEALSEVVVTASRTKFSTEKTGAATNINSSQISQIPTVNRSISDIARLSPYASGMSFAGGDGRSTNFTIDGANLNNNFGLSSNLPGGGNPVSMDAIEEVQVVIAPFDVRQTNFIGGGINAVTKSGTNSFKGTAYTYQFNENMRGNKVDGESLGVRAKDAKHIYGGTFGGPIIKNKLFFFANVEYTLIPTTIVNWRAATPENPANPDNYISRTTAADMQRVSDFVRNQYGYDTGSYNNFPADETNWKILGRIDWNITDAHKLAVRYNYTKNQAWNQANGNSSDTGYRLNGMNRFSQYSMAFANACYSMDNFVNSVSADFNSRFGSKMFNQLLFTFTDIKDERGTNSSPFPFIDIMDGYSVNNDGQIVQNLEPYMSLGYELFTYNNAVRNKIYNIVDNFTYYAGDHKITAGFSYERQFANNAYMRNGTGYYRYRSVDDFINGATPEAFALTYGYNGNTKPAAEVKFNQIGFYLQDEWNIRSNFKLSYGIRFDEVIFDEKDLMRNNAIYEYCFNGKHIDTGKWPGAKMQVSPRVGFIWDIFDDNSLKLRGGTGLFTGRLPLVFFTNMPTNSGMVQNSITRNTRYTNGVATSINSDLSKFQGNFLTNVDDMIKLLGLPTTINPEQGVAPSSMAGIDRDFKMPQVWKSSIAVDYTLPISFPFNVTTEFMYTKNVNAVKLENWNIKSSEGWERFEGPDNRLIYPSDYKIYSGVSSADVLTNTSKGYGWTANITLNAEPIKNLPLMLAYTHTESKEVSGMPGSNANSAWQGLYTINGPNFADVQRSQYVTPDRIIASAAYKLPYNSNYASTQLSLFYTGYSPNGTSFCYTNDMNGDGIQNDLMYIPKDDSEIIFTNEADRVAFWNFVEQDKYLRNNKGNYAEAYAGRAPWVHRFDFRIAQNFSVRAGKTTNTLQVSLDIMNVGNLLKSSWGVTKNSVNANNGRILKYEGLDSNTNRPMYSMWKDKQGNAPTTTYAYNRYFGETWKLQVGVRYIFN